MSNSQTSKGNVVLNQVYAFLGRFVAYPSDDARVAHTLWIAHAHLMGAWENTPRLAFLSAEWGSGKTRALEITELLVPRPVQSVNATPAYLFRRVSDLAGRPTVLYDEIDTVFGEKARDNEELRGLINAGHRKGAKAGRCVTKGNEIVTEDFPAYCAVAMAGLGNLPDTILSRSVVVRMRRRKRDEVVEPFRQRLHEPEGVALRDQLAAWADTIEDTIGVQYPEMPPGVEDRNADVWEPLLAVADAAGGIWPARARVSAVSLVSLSRKDGGGSLGVRLLTDLRIIFGEEDKLHTTTILDRLHNLEEAPWDSIKGQPVGDRFLAQLLKQYGVESKQVRIGNNNKKGYERGDFIDSWERYLPPLPPPETAKQAKQEKQTPSPILPESETSETKETETKPRVIDISKPHPFSERVQRMTPKERKHYNDWAIDGVPPEPWLELELKLANSAREGTPANENNNSDSGDGRRPYGGEAAEEEYTIKAFEREIREMDPSYARRKTQ